MENEEIKEQTVVPEEAEEETAPAEEIAAEEAVEEAKEEKKEDRKRKKDKKNQKDSKDEEIALLNDKFLRLCAEYDNFKKRSQREKDGIYAESKGAIIKEFLPVYDNLERALKQQTEDEAYKKGVEMIMNQFRQSLEKLGVEQIPALGEKFNPELHNAVMHVEDEEKGENEIVEVFQQGFKLSDKVIRFAMVKVAN